MDIISTVSEIGRLKKELPFNQRSWCNQLGLFVRLTELADLGKLEAGFKTKAFFIARRADPFEEWQVKRYENGDRERLVDPSYKLTLWIHEFGGVTEDTIQQYERIIERFRRTGELILPVG